MSYLERPSPTRLTTPDPDMLVLSHLRWDFVYQRPQHLLSRFARGRRVFFWEEPVVREGPARLELVQRDEKLWICIPQLPAGRSRGEIERMQRTLIEQLWREQGLHEPTHWYYTPMALGFTRQLPARTIVYDCMDELSAFAGAPPQLCERERELLAAADLVFTGGYSLWEAKRDLHPSVHPFPSSIDAAHFERARALQSDEREPADQAAIPHPRLGFFGVIDERLDLELLAGLADARPEWQIVMIGPVVKIDEASLPRRPNIHYLGGKPYAELPEYIAGWEVALMPFARNAATRFISPTKTPEYLAAGKPVVSTSIRDVFRPYGERGLVAIADDVAGFVAASEAALERVWDRSKCKRWLAEVDAFLAGSSWDATWTRMHALVQATERGGAQPVADLGGRADARTRACSTI